MKALLLFASLLFVAATIGCQSKTSEPGTILNPAETSDETPVKSPAVTAVCLWKEISIKESPGEKGKYLTSVYLGEKIEVLADTASEKVNERTFNYQRVKLVDGTEGWIRKEFIAINAIPAAFLRDAVIYKRPDLMTSTKKSFTAMDFVAIKSSNNEGWAEVIGKRAGDTWFTSGWVRNENLTTGPKDVMFTVLYAKAMEIKDETERTAEVKNILNNSDLAESAFYSRIYETYGDNFEGEGPAVEADTTAN